ncbi:hypothetical protein BDSB_00225 [Burkholderia dolosa PC543]|nr:hypothetical protein BDSB_00225 [Burkholderia dolosa PC543]
MATTIGMLGNSPYTRAARGAAATAAGARDRYNRSF